MEGLTLTSVCLLVVTVVICSANDPCLTKKQVPKIDKRDRYYQIASEESYINDRFLSTDWYKTSNSKTLLDSPPGFQHCGTLFPIWRKRKEPGLSVMCIQTFDDECYVQFNIRTKMCGSREVYQLTQSRVYRSGYCFGSPVADKPPVFNEKPTVEYELVQLEYASELKFSCQFKRHPEDVFYSTNWLVDNKLIVTRDPEKWNNGDVMRIQALTETQLRVANIKKYGIQISCSVRASYGIKTALSVPVSSDKKFIGIKVSPTSVVVKEGESTDIMLQLTAPFGCGFKATGPCLLLVAVHTIKNPKHCKEAALVGSFCGVQFDAASWNKPLPLKVFGKITGSYGASKSVINLKLKTPIDPFNKLWSLYDVGLIKVQVVKDTSISERKSCGAVNDPHMNTFDGRRYEHQYEGIFTMYKHNSLPIEVQLQTEKCSPGSSTNAFCNCGVAIRAGRTVFEFNRCAGQSDIWTLEYTLCEDGGDVLQVKRKGSNYEVFLPTGGKVQVTVGSRFLNVHVYPSVQDIRNSSGLCGYLSGVCKDDFVMRDGSYSRDPTATGDCRVGSKVWVNVLEDFSSSWRVERGNLFDFNDHAYLKRWPKQNTFCSCPKEIVFGEPSSQVDCTAGKAHESCKSLPGYTDVPPTKCSIKGRKTAKRVQPTKAKISQRGIGGYWRNGWTESRARDHCVGLFRNSKSVDVCKTIQGVETSGSIDNCMADIWLTGTTMFDKYSLEAVRGKCLHEVVVNTAHKCISDDVIAQSCFNDCSGRGTCVDGDCECFTNYGGDDCSVDLRKPPVLTEIENNGHCDMSRDKCQVISVYGETFTEDAKCIVFRFKVTKSGVVFQSSTTSQALVQSISHVKCNITKIYHSQYERFRRESFASVAARTLFNDTLFNDTEEEYVYGYRISVANGDEDRSNSLGLMVYDGTCITAFPNGTDFRWSLKGPFCVHEGKCFGHYAFQQELCGTCNATSGVWERSFRQKRQCWPRSS